MKTFCLSLIIILAFTVLNLYGDDSAMISSAQGSSFIIKVGTKRTQFNILDADVIGLPVRVGDTIITDANSTVVLELQAPNAGVIQLAESTTVFIKALDSENKIFVVDSGRIRMILDTPLQVPDLNIWVFGPDTAAGISGINFGYDVSYNGSEFKTDVYCFEGEIEVFRHNQGVISKMDLLNIEPFTLTSNRMVQTQSIAPKAKLYSVPINQEKIAYWDSYMKETVVLAAEEPLPQEIPDALTFNEAQEKENFRLGIQLGGKLSFGIGIGMMTTGMIIKAVSPYNATANLLYIGLLAVGGTTTIIGGGLLGYAISLD